jgi:hypothetical protein
MADKRPGDPVQFTYESAERIADVVRAAETAGPSSAPLTFEPRLTNRMPKQVRAAKFSGNWPIGVTKTISFRVAPTGTASVTNLSWPLNSTAYSDEDCIVGREGTNWWLVVPVLATGAAIMVTQTATAVFITQTATAQFVKTTVFKNIVTAVSTAKDTINYLTDVSVSGSLNTTDCTLSISVTKSTASKDVIVLCDVATATAALCAITASAIVIVTSITGIAALTTARDVYFKPRRV